MSKALSKFEEGLSGRMIAKQLPARFGSEVFIVILIQYVIPWVLRLICGEEAAAREFVKAKREGRVEKAVVKSYFGGSKKRYREEGGEKIKAAYIEQARSTSLQEAKEIIREVERRK